MKKAFFLIAIALVCGKCRLSAYEGYAYLTFTASDGQAQSVEADGLTITFADGKATATNSTGSQTFELSSLANMQFTDEKHVSAIATTEANGKAQQTEVFTTAGVYVGKFSSIQVAKAELRPGVYLMKSPGRTTKLAISPTH